MYRKIMCMFILVCLTFTGCEAIKPGRDFKDVSRKLLKLNAYTCDVTMRVTNNKSTMEYQMKHFYKSPDKYKVEIQKPKELSGQLTIYNGSSSYVYHPGINQYLVTENFIGSVEYKSNIGSFMEYIRKPENISVSSEKDGEKKLMVLELEIPKPNNYMSKEKLWLDPEAIVPVKAEIYGNDGKANVEIYYTNFVYNPDLKDGDFEIIYNNQ